MGEALFIALCGILVFQFSSSPWLLANCDERFVFLFGERNAQRFNSCLGAILFVVGFAMGVGHLA